MPQLRVEFLAGFRDDLVILRLDGHEVHRQSDLTTDYSIGLAGGVDLDADAGPHSLEIELPLRQLKHGFTLHTTGPLFVRFELKPSGRIHSHIAHEPQLRL